VPGRRQKEHQKGKNVAKTRLINEQEKRETRGVPTSPPRAPSAARTRGRNAGRRRPPRSTPAFNGQCSNPTTQPACKAENNAIRHPPHAAPAQVFPFPLPLRPATYISSLLPIFPIALSLFVLLLPLNGQLSSAQRTQLSSAQRFRQAAAADIA
jgi:hypothetical protein